MDCPLTAPPYHSGHFADADAALRPGGLELTRHALRCARFTAGQRIVDLGCGEAAGTALLRHASCLAIGVDRSRRALDIAAQRLAAQAETAAEDLAPVSLVAADAEQLPFATASLDGMLAECALSLTGFSPAALAECQRVLRPGARLAITDVYARASDDDRPAALSGCLARCTGRNEIVARLIGAGFRIERWENHSALLKTFVARLIFESDSLDSLWRGATTDDAAALSASLRRSRPGYFLLIVSKPAKESRQ
jgi:arsenite methyltransferase